MHKVEREVELPAQPPDVWQEIVDGDWLGDEARIPARPGADGWVREAGELRHVVVEDVVEQQRLTFRWWRVDPAGVCEPTRVTIELDPTDEQHTRVAITEVPVAPATPLPSAGGPVALAFA